MENLTNISEEFILEEEGKKTPAQKKTNVFNVNNYLNVKLAKNEDKKVLKIRLLPIDKDTPKPFMKIHMHSVMLTPEQQGNNVSKWKSYICLKQTDGIDHDKLGYKCPFCEENSKAYKAYTEATNEVEKEAYKAIYRSYFPIEYGIIRCIERGHEEDGPKFWKFPIRQDGKDPMNTINRLYHSQKEESIEMGEPPLNILDINDGKDFKITIEAVYDKQHNRTDKTSISIEPYGKRKPLSEDINEMIKWVNDEKKWSDVFVAKPYDYLSLIIDKKVPFYDKANGVWCAMTGGTQNHVEKKVNQNELTESNKKIEAARSSVLNAASSHNEISSVVEDLPF